MIDVLARLSGPLAIGSDTPAAIELLGGGSAANTAAWLAEAGAVAVFAGRTGADDLGQQARAALAASGVRVVATRDASRPSGICIVLVDRDGERTMIPAAGANDGPLPVPDELVVPGTHLHVSGYAFFHDGSRPSALAALDRSRRAGGTASVDAASAMPLRTAGAERFLGWLGSGTLLLANADEVAVLTGSSDPLAGVRTLGARCGEAVVKLGASGAAWSDGTRVVTARPRALEPIDTTGAGDAFAAGLLAARLGGAEVDAALAAGNDLAARAIVRIGARPPLAQDRV
jgi:ribokinase